MVLRSVTKPKNALDVAIIDYKMSNLHSVQAACSKMKLKSAITSDQDLILKAKSAILPGVGGFGEAMVHIKELKLDKCIKDFIETGKPFVGICLGMQLLFTESEEYGHHRGLGIVEGRVLKFDFPKISGERYPVPQIGWNRILENDSGWNRTLLEDNNNGDFMYFVHSYYVIPSNVNISISHTSYGSFEYCSALNNENVFAFQFHPEKSSDDGLKIYKCLKERVR